MDNKIGRLIRGIRKENGDRLQDLGKKVGYSYGGLAKIERGENKASIDLLEKIAEVYGVPVSYFIGEEQKLPKELENKAEWLSFIGEAEQRELSPNELIEVLEFLDKWKK